VTGGPGTHLARVVARLPEFAGFRRMLDLGGGHGMFALYFVEAHPQMTCVVFDRPAVVAVADDFARKYGLQDRVSTMAGDYLADDIGSGYDLIWACATLNFARHDLDTLIGKILAALNPGGVFIAFQDGMTDERTQPDMMLGHLGDTLRSVHDFSFDQEEIAASILRCGFRSVQSRTIDTPTGAMDLDVARK
jgi:predicted TPR repeat methyltransferase